MMPLARKETYEDWPFFKDDKGEVSFASKCRKCTLECKQSFRVTVCYCPKYKSVILRGGKA